jgi:hypothetical protein
MNKKMVTDERREQLQRDVQDLEARLRAVRNEQDLEARLRAVRNELAQLDAPPITPGDPVEILPAYSMDTRARTRIDEWTGMQGWVLTVDKSGGFADIELSNGEELNIHVGRLLRTAEGERWVCSAGCGARGARRAADNGEGWTLDCGHPPVSSLPDT